ncbi:NAD(P)H-binding protein [Cryptosporangium minutisporangium]|uniref:NAD(P)H-binding protein n=1 Tax=Cryptosporangium minutisporangium TaxID=113569 RepID=A0ABP6TAG8_9ACTN
MPFLVTGATGRVGRCVVDQLLAAGAEVRALTRHPERAGLPSGVQVVGGDLDRPDELGAAFAGVTHAYLIAMTADPEALVAAARKAGVRRVVVLSSATAAQPGDSWHRAVEKAVEEAGLEWTHVRPGMFAANLLDWAEVIRSGQPVREPIAAARQAPIHEADVAAVAVAALLDDRAAGSIHTISGPESLTKPEQAAALGAALGRPVPFEEIDPSEWRTAVSAYLPAEVADWMLGLWTRAAEQPDPVSDTVEQVTGRPARTLREWADDHREAFR